MDYILEAVPFTNCDEEPRLHAIIEDLIVRGEVPEYKSFTKEDEKKKQRRKRKVSAYVVHTFINLMRNENKFYVAQISNFSLSSILLVFPIFFYRISLLCFKKNFSFIMDYQVFNYLP